MTADEEIEMLASELALLRKQGNRELEIHINICRERDELRAQLAAAEASCAAMRSAIGVMVPCAIKVALETCPSEVDQQALKATLARVEKVMAAPSPGAALLVLRDAAVKHVEHYKREEVRCERETRDGGTSMSHQACGSSCTGCDLLAALAAARSGGG